MWRLHLYMYTDINPLSFLIFKKKKIWEILIFPLEKIQKNTVLISWKLTALSLGTKLIQNACKVKDSFPLQIYAPCQSVCRTWWSHWSPWQSSTVFISHHLFSDHMGQPKGIPTHLCSAGPVSMVTDARATARMTPFKHLRGDNYCECGLQDAPGYWQCYRDGKFSYVTNLFLNR